MTICDGCDGILGIGYGIENIVTIVTIVTDDDGKDGLMGLKNVQISEELFFALLKYHLVEIDDVLPQIKNGLEEKLEAMVKRDLYTKYKTAPTEEEREKARQEYLEKVGMHRSFRWYFFFIRCVGRERATLLYMAVKKKAGLGCNGKSGLPSQALGV